MAVFPVFTFGPGVESLEVVAVVAAGTATAVEPLDKVSLFDFEVPGLTLFVVFLFLDRVRKDLSHRISRITSRNGEATVGRGMELTDNRGVCLGNPSLGLSEQR